MGWICNNCGTRNEDADETCMVCDAAKAAAAVPPTPPAPEPTPVPTPAPSGSVKTLTKLKVRELGLSGEVVIPPEFNVIGEDAFRGSTITGVTIHANVKKIEKRAFSDCSFLRRVIVQGTLDSIGARAFYNCTSLNSAARPKARYVASDAFKTSSDTAPSRAATPTPAPTPTPTRATPTPAPTPTPTRATPTPAPTPTPTRTSSSTGTAATTTRRNPIKVAFDFFMNYGTRLSVAILLLGLGIMAVDGLRMLTPYLWWRIGLPNAAVWVYSVVTAIILCAVVYPICTHFYGSTSRLKGTTVASWLFFAFAIQCIVACFSSYDLGILSAGAGFVYAYAYNLMGLIEARAERSKLVGIGVSVIANIIAAVYVIALIIYY